MITIAALAFVSATEPVAEDAAVLTCADAELTPAPDCTDTGATRRFFVRAVLGRSFCASALGSECTGTGATRRFFVRAVLAELEPTDILRAGDRERDRREGDRERDRRAGDGDLDRRAGGLALAKLSRFI